MGKAQTAEAKRNAIKKAISQWRNQEGSLKLHQGKVKMEAQLSNSMGCSKSGSKREVYSNTGLPSRTKKISNNLTYHLKGIRKRTDKVQSQQKEGSNKRGNKILQTAPKIGKNISMKTGALFCFVFRINKIDKPLAKLLKKKKREGSNKQK